MHVQNLMQQNGGRYALILRIPVGKMLADVAKARAAKQGVGKGVQQHVAVGVGEHLRRAGDAHAAKAHV